MKFFFCLECCLPDLDHDLDRSPALGYTKFTPAETRVECRVGIELGHAVQQAGVLNVEQRRTLLSPAAPYLIKPHPTICIVDTFL